MTLLENENIILESDDKSIILTNYRVRYYKDKGYTSILIENVSDIEKTSYNKNILYIIIGIISIYLAFISKEAEFFFPLITLGIFLTYYYLKSIKNIVAIHSKGEKSIIFKTKGLKKELIDNFIFRLEENMIRNKV